jgi:hypothetical protein
MRVYAIECLRLAGIALLVAMIFALLRVAA